MEQKSIVEYLDSAISEYIRILKSIASETDDTDEGIEIMSAKNNIINYYSLFVKLFMIDKEDFNDELKLWRNALLPHKDSFLARDFNIFREQQIQITRTPPGSEYIYKVDLSLIHSVLHDAEDTRSFYFYLFKILAFCAPKFGDAFNLLSTSYMQTDKLNIKGQLSNMTDMLGSVFNSMGRTFPKQNVQGIVDVVCDMPEITDPSKLMTNPNAAINMVTSLLGSHHITDLISKDEDEE